MSNIQQMSFLPEIQINGDAIIEDSYRYLLRRWWEQESDQPLLWILLNPSKADGTSNDATLLRVIDFTRREGYHHLEIVNLYAWRSTDPKELRQAENPIGTRNDAYILQAAKRADKIIVGWGNNSFHFRDREVLDLLTDQHLWTFGLTQKGHPRHPLYLKREAPLLPFRITPS